MKTMMKQISVDDKPATSEDASSAETGSVGNWY